jgi:hypothetical protein
MRVDVDVNFRTLQNFQPSEESGDEPYLWTFVFKLDRETVHQQPSGSFVGTIQVTTAPGSHGNLSVEDMSGGHVSLPAPLGHHTAALRAITMRFGTVTSLCPGKLFMISVLLDEDLSTSDGDAEATHQSLRMYYEQQVNAFVAGLDPNDILNAASGGTLSHVAIVEQRIAALVARLAAESRQWVQIEYLSRSSIFAFWESFDRDDYITAATFVIDEGVALNAPPSPEQPVKFDLQAFEDGHWAAWYQASGSRMLSVQSEAIDFIKVGEALAEIPNRSVEETATFTDANAGLCVTAGRTVTWKRIFQQETELFRFVYPFIANIIFSIDGQDLTPPSNSLMVPTMASFPRFDTASPGRPVWDTVPRTVRVNYEFTPDGRGVHLSNIADDGTYTVIVRVDGLIGGPGGTRVPLASLPAVFDGQAIDSPWYEEYAACIERFRSPSYDYAKSKRVGPKELWGPTARLRWFEQQRKRGEELLESRQISREEFEVGLRQLENRAAVKQRSV